MQSNIHILTGKIQTGKTTRLFNFANSHKSIDGILAPIIENKRWLYHISTKTLKEHQVNQSGEETIEVGKYSFIKDSFEWANQKLIKGIELEPEWLIIDELGKLELRKEGLHNSAQYIIDHRTKNSTKIILVIRDYILEQNLGFYNINKGEYQFLNFND